MGHTVTRKNGLNRLEDFISLSQKGEKISLDVHLRTEKILRQEEQCEDKKDIIDGYLFIGDFFFYLDNDKYIVSKVYSLSYLTKNPNDLHVDRHVTNARLKMDYTRLQNGGIQVQERYFAEEDCF
jgi:hypothetical protein